MFVLPFMFYVVAVPYFLIMFSFFLLRYLNMTEIGEGEKCSC